MKKVVTMCPIKMMKFHLSVVSDPFTTLFMESSLVSDTVIFWKQDVVSGMRQLESYE